MYLLEAVTAPPRCRFMKIRKTYRGIRAHIPAGGQWVISIMPDPRSRRPEDYRVLERSDPSFRAAHEFWR